MYELVLFRNFGLVSLTIAQAPPSLVDFWSESQSLSFLRHSFYFYPPLSCPPKGVLGDELAIYEYGRQRDAHVAV